MNLSTQKPVIPATVASNTFSTKENFRAQALSLGIAGVVPFPMGTATIDSINLSFDGIGNTTVTGGPTTGTLNLGGIPATSVGSYAFYGCSGFNGSLVLPNSLTSIGTGAFYNCSGFTGSLVLPNSVTSIGTGAFYGCSLLTTVYADVDASVVSSNTFGSSGVTQIYYHSTKTGWTNPWNGIATAVWTNYPNIP